MSLTPIRISVVSYLNSKPFIYGLRQMKFNNDVEIMEDTPSECAEKLINGKADIGLVPVAIVPSLKDKNIISDYCIGSNGRVNSVLLLSHVPLNEIKSILLDYQSRTSVLLTRVLAKEFWNIEPEWKSTLAGFESQISDSTAGVVIGDRALVLKKSFPYVYDLSEEWKKMTGLPFVFACWISTVILEEKFLNDFNRALENGLEKIDEIAKEENSADINSAEIKNYLTNNIDFSFDSEKKIAMDLFLKMASELNEETVH